MSLEDDASFGGRIRRYARVGGAMAGLGARVAGNKVLGLKLDRQAHADELRAALGGLKGPLMKVAQILSTIPDVLPEEYVAELQQLQSNAPPMGWNFVKRRMQTELGTSWRQRFVDFEHEATHAASLGQVHRAALSDGAQVACKLQYPDMASAVDADLRQLKLVFSVYERYDRAISTRQIHAELSERLREELDYAREVKQMRLYAHMLRDEPEVVVPEPVTELCTPRLITMGWLDGKPLLSFRDADQDTRNTIARAMFRAWYVPFYGYGVIHGDPHLGNYAVRQDFGINLLDFGCIRVFPPSFVTGVLDLFRALDTGDDDLARDAYGRWGFTNISDELLEVLNLWARFIYKPVLADRVQTIEETNSGRYGAEVAAKVHQELKRVGGVEPPREFVLMDRAAIGLGSVFMHLKAEINWRAMFFELIEDYQEARLAARQTEALNSVGLA
jgi:predicted unusual protein kinase regulating ubiquinone biosynthesis (AarF/ABC1/UbiB family)